MEKGTQVFINEERARCAALVEAIDHKQFLLYCINAPVHPGEDLVHFRKRFDELQPEPAPVRDDVEDLM